MDDGLLPGTVFSMVPITPHRAAGIADEALSIEAQRGAPTIHMAPFLRTRSEEAEDRDLNGTFASSVATRPVASAPRKHRSAALGKPDEEPLASSLTRHQPACHEPAEGHLGFSRLKCTT